MTLPLCDNPKKYSGLFYGFLHRIASVEVKAHTPLTKIILFAISAQLKQVTCIIAVAEEELEYVTTGIPVKSEGNKVRRIVDYLSGFIGNILIHVQLP